VLAPVLAALLAASSPLSATPAPAVPVVPLDEAGAKLEAVYAARLAAAKGDIAKALPAFDPSFLEALRLAEARAAAAQVEADAAQKALGSLASAKGLVDHAKGKWIGGADKGIAQAKAALAKASTDAARAAAQADLAKWEANRADGLKALAERQAAYDKLKADEPRLASAHEAAQAALSRAREAESAAAARLLAAAQSLLDSDRLDARLAEAVVLTQATPRGLAAFAAQGPVQARLVEELLADTALLRELLAAGGAKFGQWGRAAEILAAIRQSSPRAADGVLRRLALAVALEHARPIPRNNTADQKASAPAVVDPVARYRHYEQAFLAGELDPAFARLGTWELRLVVNADAPDEILAWGRQMLRTYRPDIAALPDMGWRYSMLVRTDVRYGSQNVKDDLPSLHQHQNIPLNGGVCGRRAFFGRFILRAHGIPTWGVTQHKHAALSRWTPKGWVVNLGAGFQASWWDKDEAAMSGNEFLLETQARARGDAFAKVLRARWVSLVLGEPARNERRKLAGGLWSNLAHRQALALAAGAAALGPLGQELAEADEAPGARQAAGAFKPAPEHRRVAERDGSLVVPIVAGQRLAGQALAMASHGGGAQAHWTGGHKAAFRVEVPRAGRYRLTALVATLQSGQRLLVSAPGQPASEIAVPHTIGLWQSTPAAEITLAAGANTLQVELTSASRGVTVKELVLAPPR
jgi:hypothetical protein